MASVPKSSGESPKPRSTDRILRGIKQPNVPGTLTFVGLRAVEPILQYGILARGFGSSLLQSVGLESLPAGPPNTGTTLDSLGLSPYRLILLGMAVGSAVKQIYWLLGTSEEEMPPGSAVGVSAFNAFVNSTNSILFTCSLTSASLSSGSRFPQTPLLVGAFLYATGIVVEAVSETQRKTFKNDPKNRGKAYTSGLWSLSRHINYFSYTVWRTGYALAAGGWTWAAVNAGFFVANFVMQAIPSQEDYCAERYGIEWEEYKRKTPYQLIPYVY